MPEPPTEPDSSPQPRREGLAWTPLLATALVCLGAAGIIWVTIAVTPVGEPASGPIAERELTDRPTGASEIDRAEPSTSATSSDTVLFEGQSSVIGFQLSSAFEDATTLDEPQQSALVDGQVLRGDTEPPPELWPIIVDGEGRLVRSDVRFVLDGQTLPDLARSLPLGGLDPGAHSISARVPGGKGEVGTIVIVIESR